MKCNKCGKKIEIGAEAYYHGLVLCCDCFVNIKYQDTHPNSYSWMDKLLNKVGGK